MDIYYISNNYKITDSLKELTPKGINLIEHSINHKLGDIEVLLIVEPIHNRYAYLSIARTWKKYLKKESPNTKLLIIGFQEASEIDYPNYIDLLGSSTKIDWKKIIQNTQPVKEQWHTPIRCLCMQQKLKRFFDGHGYEDSLMTIIIALRMTLNIAHTRFVYEGWEYQEVKEEILEKYALGEWRELYSRWRNYYPLFSYLPFYPIFQEIDQQLNTIAMFFESELGEEGYQKTYLFKKIDVIQKKMNYISITYVKN